MTLDRYLEHHRLTPSSFARAVPLAPSTITRLLAGERSPSFDLLRTICVATRGQVTPNDFLPAQVKEEFGLIRDLEVSP